MAIVKNIEPKIGEGIFLTKDVSDILKIPYSRVRRWMVELWDEKFGNDFFTAFGEKGNKAVNFYTLIEFYTYFFLREEKVPWKKIFNAHKIIAKDLNAKYPFATRVRTDGRGIWYEQLGNIIKADGKKQFDFESIIGPFLKRIDFGIDELAERYYPLENNKIVVVDPKHQFGQPTIFGTNITTEIISKFHKGGETIKNIAILYDINEEQVKSAILCHKPTG